MPMLRWKIKALRESKLYSQEYMATQLNITQASYSRIESGITRPDIEKILRIAEVLGVEITYFIEKGTS